MIESFNEYSSTKGTLTIEGDVDLGELEENWAYILDIRSIWDENDTKSFNNSFSEYIISKRQELESISKDFYNKLYNLLVELKNEDSSNGFYDKIYDLCDEYEIKIQA